LWYNIGVRGYKKAITQPHLHNNAYTRIKEAYCMENAIVVTDRAELAQSESLSAEIFTKWIEYIDAKPKTIETYTRNIKQFLRYLQVNEISRPARSDVIAYREELKATKKPSTVQGYLMAVKLFFQWTEQEGLYPDIAKHIKGAKLDTEHKKDYLTSKQVARLLGSIDRHSLKGLRDYAIIALMITSGLRTIEVARANIEDMRTVADFTALYIQGKGHEERTAYVKIAEPVEDAIREYLKARGRSDKSEPLFVSDANRNAGGRMTTRSISRIAKDSLIAAGLESDRLTAHSFRHTTATLNLLNGGTVEETQQLLRHTNINTTLIYSHALERAKNNSEARVAKAIFG